MLRINRHFLVPLILIVCMAIWSAIKPFDVLTWFLEAIPIILIVAVVFYYQKSFPLTPLSYWLLALGCVLVFIGAHFTYARVPAFDAIKDMFNLERNNYDRFGHFFQGFIPAIIFRELILRTSSMRRGLWLWVILIALCTTKSVLYEFAEWWTTIVLGENAHEFLAMQGDVWDAQKDMFCAFIGSIVSLWTLSKLHDRQLRQLKSAA